LKALALQAIFRTMSHSLAKIASVLALSAIVGCSSSTLGGGGTGGSTGTGGFGDTGTGGFGGTGTGGVIDGGSAGSGGTAGAGGHGGAGGAASFTCGVPGTLTGTGGGDGGVAVLPATCIVGQSYCQVSNLKNGTSPGQCQPIPTGCGATVTCGCLAQSSYVNCKCQDHGGGLVTLSCDQI
jgi:hypothetical protein